MALSAAPKTAIRLHTVEAGAGPTVVCLHSSGSSSGQWRRLIEAEQSRYRLLAIDFYGHGGSPGQPPHFDLACELDAVWDAIAPTGDPVHLVGHSYGGAVALALALRHAERVASVAVYEPVLFPLIDPLSPEYREITAVGLGIVHAAQAGQLESASQGFIDYWNGAGTWRAMTNEQQERSRARIVAVARHFEALFGSGLTLDRLQKLHVPTLLLHGDRSPAAARAVCTRLATLACVTAEALPGLGHMGPVTHPAAVNGAIAAHLAAQTSLREAA